MMPTFHELVGSSARKILGNHALDTRAGPLNDPGRKPVQILRPHHGHRPHFASSVGQGEVVGFLGLNGAGKTTTMRILTSYLPATSGVARVAGHDVMLESTQVRQNIGYLPESVPLYPKCASMNTSRSGPSSRGCRAPSATSASITAWSAAGSSRCAAGCFRHAFEGLSPARRPGRRHGAQSRPAHPRRTDHRPRSESNPRRALTLLKELGQQPYDLALHPHPLRSRSDLRTRHHHRQRPRRPEPAARRDRIGERDPARGARPSRPDDAHAARAWLASSRSTMKSIDDGVAQLRNSHGGRPKDVREESARRSPGKHWTHSAAGTQEPPAGGCVLRCAARGGPAPHAAAREHGNEEPKRCRPPLTFGRRRLEPLASVAIQIFKSKPAALSAANLRG
jgi:hypothetical protein